MEVLLSSDGKRRIQIVQRADGYFGFNEQYWYRSIYEGEILSEGWAALGGPASICETMEIALREARATYPWLPRTDCS